MKRILLIALITIIGMLAVCQNTQNAEIAAANCLNQRLLLSDKDFNYILQSATEILKLESERNYVQFDKKMSEVDSILTICGLMKENSLNFEIILQCLLSNYKFDEKAKDTTSAFYNLVDYVSYCVKEPQMYFSISPQIHQRVFEIIFTPEVSDKDFYRVMHFILLSGLINLKYNDSQDQVEKDETPSIIAIRKSDLHTRDTGKEVFTVVEQMPSFPGGVEARTKFLMENIIYPLEAREKGYQGTVYLTFVVEPDGRITNLRMLKGVHPSIDAEAVRVVKLMPNWEPGKQRSKPVRVQFNMPIKFTLQG